MKKKEQLLWGVLFFFTFLNFEKALAACPNIDIRETLNSSLKSFFSKSRQQGDTNWCYAYTTADILSYHTQKPISAYQIAINYNSQLGSFDRLWRHFEAWIADYRIAIWDGGFVSVALKTALNDSKGLCLEESFPSSANNLAFKKLMEKINSYLQGQSEIYMDTFEELKKSFPKISEADLLAALEEAQRNSYAANGFLEILAERSCSGAHFKPEKFKVISRNRWFHDLKATIHENILAGKPTGIIYTSTASHIVLPEEENWLTGKVPDHATVAMGSRWNKDEQACQILIRDSFGDDCSKLNSKKIQCNHDGTFWINEEPLLQNLYFTSHLVPN